MCIRDSIGVIEVNRHQPHAVASTGLHPAAIARTPINIPGSRSIQRAGCIGKDTTTRQGKAETGSGDLVELLVVILSLSLIHI